MVGKPTAPGKNPDAIGRARQILSEVFGFDIEIAIAVEIADLDVEG